MHLKDHHEAKKPVSAKPIFRTTEGSALSIQILKGEELAEHLTKIPALLICISGSATYSAINGEESNLQPGDMVNIPADLKHKVHGKEDSQLILLR